MIRASAWVLAAGLYVEAAWFTGYVLGSALNAAGSALTLH